MSPSLHTTVTQTGDVPFSTHHSHIDYVTISTHQSHRLESPSLHTTVTQTGVTISTHHSHTFRCCPHLYTPQSHRLVMSPSLHTTVTQTMSPSPRSIVKRLITSPSQHIAVTPSNDAVTISTHHSQQTNDATSTHHSHCQITLSPSLHIALKLSNDVVTILTHRTQTVK